jgi:hypothetical protein
MKTNQIPALATALVLACLALAASGCNDANTVTGPPPPSPTPPPGPPANIAGTWTGTYTASWIGFGSDRCDSPTAVDAVFEQTGADFTATFSSRGLCGIPATLGGHIDEDQLTGSASGYVFAGDFAYTDAFVSGSVLQDGSLVIALGTTQRRFRLTLTLHR